MNISTALSRRARLAASLVGVLAMALMLGTAWMVNTDLANPATVEPVVRSISDSTGCAQVSDLLDLFLL